MKESEYYNKKVAKEDNRYTVNPNIFINNSILSSINPEEGGSPIKFVKDVNENSEERISKSLSLGKLIHKYLESPDDFIVADFEMPTSDTKIAFIHSLKFEGIKDEIPEALAIRLGQQAGYKIERNKADTAWNGLHNLILKDNEKEYLNFLYESDSKIALTAKEKEQIDKMKDSLHSHNAVSQYLFNSKINVGNISYEEGVDFKRYKELAIYWEEQNGTRTINRKALIDVLIAFPKIPLMIKIDLKSTAKSIYDFSSTEFKIGTLERWRIDRQIAFYDEAIENLYLNPTAYAVTKEGKELRPFGKPLPYLQNSIIPIESFGNYLTAKIDITSDIILYGKRQVKSLINRICWHMDKNEWKYSKEEVEAGGCLPITKYSDIPRLQVKQSDFPKSLFDNKQ